MSSRVISHALAYSSLVALVTLPACASDTHAQRTSTSVETPARSSQDWEHDIQEIVARLKSDGVIGLVHGANLARGLYVFEYNKPDDFFTRYYFSLLSRDPIMKTLHRGDRIQVWGKLGAQETPQPHLIASKVEMIQAYDPHVSAPAGHDPESAVLPDELKNQKEMVVQVHAVIAEGQVLVVEYKDAILPVVVKAPANEQTRDLFRGDVIRIGFELQQRPHQPVHVIYKPRAQSPYFDVMERLVDRHGKARTIEGALTLFPKSPVINQDIWAIEENLGYGLKRYSTLVNFEQDANGNMAEWEKLKQKMRGLWAAHPESVIQGRNKFINRAVRIRASGIANVVSPSQANAQLFLKAGDVDQVK